MAVDAVGALLRSWVRPEDPGPSSSEHWELLRLMGSCVSPSWGLLAGKLCCSLPAMALSDCRTQGYKGLREQKVLLASG